MNESKIARWVVANILAKVEEGSTADFFLKEILPHFRKDIKSVLRRDDFKPIKMRGQGSVDKKNGVVEFIFDIPNPYGGGGTIPVVLRASGGYITDDDGEYFLAVSTAGMGDHTYHERMISENPKAAKGISKVMVKDAEDLLEDYFGFIAEAAAKRK